MHIYFRDVFPAGSVEAGENYGSKVLLVLAFLVQMDARSNFRYKFVERDQNKNQKCQVVKTGNRRLLCAVNLLQWEKSIRPQ